MIAPVMSSQPALAEQIEREIFDSWETHLGKNCRGGSEGRIAALRSDELLLSYRTLPPVVSSRQKDSQEKEEPQNGCRMQAERLSMSAGICAGLSEICLDQFNSSGFHPKSKSGAY